MSERFYDERFDYDPDHSLHLEVADTGALRLVTIEGEHATAVELSNASVHALRLALTRHEKRKS